MFSVPASEYVAVFLGRGQDEIVVARDVARYDFFFGKVVGQGKGIDGVGFFYKVFVFGRYVFVLCNQFVVFFDVFLVLDRRRFVFAL